MTPNGRDGDLTEQFKRMAISICRVAITEAPLILPDASCRGDAGAVLDFWGVVRELEDGREITGIEYEAHREMARYQLEVLSERAAADYELTQVVINHRVGFVGASEASLFLRVSSARRVAAFAASQWLIDELKQKVPIWKRAVFRESGGERRTPNEEAAVQV
jgi:molybdopterin synthase catalytic subunit